MSTRHDGKVRSRYNRTLISRQRTSLCAFPLPLPFVKVTIERTPVMSSNGGKRPCGQDSWGLVVCRHSFGNVKTFARTMFVCEIFVCFEFVIGLSCLLQFSLRFGDSRTKCCYPWESFQNSKTYSYRKRESVVSWLQQSSPLPAVAFQGACHCLKRLVAWIVLNSRKEIQDLLSINLNWVV